MHSFGCKISFNFFQVYNYITMPKWPWLITGALTSYIAYVNIPTSWMKKPDSTTLGIIEYMFKYVV